MYMYMVIFDEETFPNIYPDDSIKQVVLVCLNCDISIDHDIILIYTCTCIKEMIDSLIHV